MFQFYELHCEETGASLPKNNLFNERPTVLNSKRDVSNDTIFHAVFKINDMVPNSKTS